MANEKTRLETTKRYKEYTLVYLKRGLSRRDIIMNVLVEIWNDRLHDNVIWNFILKVWIFGLLALFAIGFATLMYGFISGEADVENATFGIFDTLGY